MGLTEGEGPTNQHRDQLIAVWRDQLNVMPGEDLRSLQTLDTLATGPGLEPADQVRFAELELGALTEP